MFYYRNLQQWSAEHKYPRSTGLTPQNNYKARLDYFRIPY